LGLVMHAKRRRLQHEDRQTGALQQSLFATPPHRVSLSISLSSTVLQF
jgi:hypothetical protein